MTERSPLAFWEAQEATMGKRGVLVDNVCLNCDVTFQTRPSEHRKYCGKPCFQAHMKKIHGAHVQPYETCPTCSQKIKKAVRNGV